MYRRFCCCKRALESIACRRKMCFGSIYMRLRRACVHVLSYTKQGKKKKLGGTGHNELEKFLSFVADEKWEHWWLMKQLWNKATAYVSSSEPPVCSAGLILLCWMSRKVKKRVQQEPAVAWWWMMAQQLTAYDDARNLNNDTLASDVPVLFLHLCEVEIHYMNECSLQLHLTQDFSETNITRDYQ